ncbi:hypothetical protein [Adhaeribacter aquaticus]
MITGSSIYFIKKRKD